jgi:hypothetical protein
LLPPGGFAYVSPTKSARGADTCASISTPPWRVRSAHSKYDHRPSARAARPSVLIAYSSPPIRRTTSVKRGDHSGPSLICAVEHSRNPSGASAKPATWPHA